VSTSSPTMEGSSRRATTSLSKRELRTCLDLSAPMGSSLMWIDQSALPPCLPPLLLLLAHQRLVHRLRRPRARRLPRFVIYVYVWIAELIHVRLPPPRPPIRPPTASSHRADCSSSSPAPSESSPDRPAQNVRHSPP
jgi:hypothetical protein